MKARLLAIDGQPLLYRSYYQRTGRTLQTKDGLPSGAMFGFLRSVLALKQRFPDAHMAFAFDCGPSWRNTILADYKHYGSRVPPVGFADQLAAVQQFLGATGYPILCEKGLEADDLLSVLVSRWIAYFPKHMAIIVSSDRDFFQLVSDKCVLYDDRQKRFFGPDEVEKSVGVCPEEYLTYKCLVGDPADHIKGVDGYGKVKAAKLAPNIGDYGVQLSPTDLVLFQRNHLLMKLPRHVGDLRVSAKHRQQIEETVSSLIQRWVGDIGILPRSMNKTLAQALLDKYECHSLTLDDFLEDGMHHEKRGP